MAGEQTIALFDAALKEIYTKDEIMNLAYRDNPAFALMPKYTDFYGDVLPVPLIYANPQGRSASFTNAQANKTPSKLIKFNLTREQDYALASVSTEVLLASSNDTGAFLEAATTEMDGAIQSLTRSIAVAMYRDGTGSIGQIATNAAITTADVLLRNVDDVTNFEVGMTIQLNDGSNVLAGGTAVIQGVDRDTGTLTFSAALNSIISTATVSSFINVQGDFNEKIKGFDAWIPSSAPTSASFFGVDRSVDATRLGGIRVDGSALPIEEALIEGLSRISREGGKPDHCFLSFEKYSDLEKALGSKVQYVDLRANAEIAFRGIMLNGPRGMVKVVPDQNALSASAFMLQMDTWKLYSLGDAPSVMDIDGTRWLRESANDALETRLYFFGQLATRAPGFNGRVSLS